MTTLQSAQRLIAFYADDFTGGSASMEVLTLAGVETVMFLQPPTDAQLAMFPDIQAMGIAGVARARDPIWMEQNLPAAFTALANFGAPIAHYKTCSTLDSSPTIGSIGKAIELGGPILGGSWHPLVMGAPAISRYQAFGNLFAGIGDQTYRLDRHPIMCQHPVTPMDESDVALHLAKQTDLRIGLVDLLAMKSGQAALAVNETLSSGATVVSLDVLDSETLRIAGDLIWADGQGPVFAVGSQGVEYALVEHWRATGAIPAAPMPRQPESIGSLLAVSGSCSAITAAQIKQATADGFVVIDLEPALAVGNLSAWMTELNRVTGLSLDLLSKGRDVLVATAAGPGDPRSDRLARALTGASESAEAVNDRIGLALGSLLREARVRLGISRVVVAGGDTSGHATTVLGAYALSVIAPLTPGVPLCKVHAADTAIDGLEIALKGGQMGDVAFFRSAKT